MKTLLILLLAGSLTFIVPYGAAKNLSDGVMHLVQEQFSLSQAGLYFLGAFSHRFFHFIFAIAVLHLIYKRKEIGKIFDICTLRNGMIEFRGVFILWPIITVLFFVGSMVFIDGFGVYLSALYESTDGWMLARVSRDFLLIDAFPEEAFYRAFMIGLLSLGFRNKLSIGKYHLSQAALISVPLFAISHVQVSLIPFTIIAYDTIQLTLTLITGLLFAYAYERTHSIAVPILLHGYTNLVITVSAYVVLHLFIH